MGERRCVSAPCPPGPDGTGRRIAMGKGGIQRAPRGRYWRKLEPLEDRPLLAAFVVRTTNDSGPDSLRQAILSANATPGLNSILFSINSGAQTITPLSALPSIANNPVLVDGTSQPGYA